MRMRIGPVDTDDMFNQKVSPYFHTEKVKVPLFVAQGKNDPRVKQEYTERMVSSLIDAGKDVEYLQFEDEGHNILRPTNRKILFDRIEGFLANHLGGRCEDMRDEK